MVNAGVSAVVETAQLRQGPHFFLYDSSRITQIESGHFDPAWWARQDKLLGAAQGRGAAAFVDAGEGGWVLRHYRRGGLAAKLITDHYLWLGSARCRAFCEWRLLAELYQRGLPVPRPIAAYVRRGGLSYQADLITARLSGAETLAQFLQQQRLPSSQWQVLGTLIARFHNEGVYHHDLNAHNIMLGGAGEFSLIDFDKSRLRAHGAWKKANCERLLRSLRKLEGAGTEFYFTQSDWQALFGGYLAGSS